MSSTLSYKEKKKKSLILSHGISEEEFFPDRDIDIENFILYVGNIDHRLDCALIEKLAVNFPKELFLFIGKIRNTKNEKFNNLFIEKKYKNLIVKEPIHFKELKNYIAKSKLCLAPMDMAFHGNNINHHKLLQYFALGKPILSPVFKDYSANKELVLSYKNNEEAISKVNWLLNKKEDKEVVLSRINFAKEHTYNNLIHKVEQFLNKE